MHIHQNQPYLVLNVLLFSLKSDTHGKDYAHISYYHDKLDSYATLKELRKTHLLFVM